MEKQNSNINGNEVVKSEVVKEVFKWARERCRKQKIRVEDAEKEYKRTLRDCYFEDEMCIIEGAKIDFEREKAKLEAYVDVKIGIEKFMRKCRHEEEERERLSKNKEEKV